MKTALSVSGNRLAPLFDVAKGLLVIDWQPGTVLTRQEWLGEGSPLSILTDLKSMGVEQLVCGAISRPVQQLARFLKIECRGFLTGELPDIVAALVAGELDDEKWAMPGCYLQETRMGRNRRPFCRRSRNSSVKETT